MIGFIISSITNNTVHKTLGQRGVASIGGVCQLVAYLTFSLHPPFPVLVIVLIINGYGEGLKNAGWNSWIGKMSNANEVLGILHGLYGLGATLSPLIATIMITRGNHWYDFYFILVGGVALDVLLSTAAFWDRDGAFFRETTRLPDHSIILSSGSQVELSTLHQRLKTSRTLLILKHRPTWICASFLLAYVGSEIALGGWIVTFMLRVRHARFASGHVPPGSGLVSQ